MKVVAIYHCSIKNIGRSDGRSAVACSAYRAAQKLRDKETGLLHDFTKKSEVIYSEIFLCKNAPAEYADRETLWNEVQKIEKNKNARLAREWELALPNELTVEQSKKLICDFSKTLVEEGMCVDVNIHWKDNNHHAHIMGTTRAIKENGEWAPKAKKVYDLDENGERIYQKTDKTGKKIYKNHKEEYTNWNKEEKIEEWRERWADHCNQYLEKEQQIDHRSYERQKIDYIPTIHEGYAARLIEKRGGIAERCEINREIVEKNNLLQVLRQQIRELNTKITELIGEKGKQANERINRLLNRAGRTAHQRDGQTPQSERGTVTGSNKPAGATFEERLSKLRSPGASGTMERKSLQPGRTDTEIKSRDVREFISKLDADEQASEEKRNDKIAQRKDREISRERQSTKGKYKLKTTEQRITDSNRKGYDRSLKVKRDYAEKERILNTRQLKISNAKRNQNILIQRKAEELYKAKKYSQQAFNLSFLCYSCLITLFTAIRSETLRIDFTAFLIQAGNILKAMASNAYKTAIRASEWGSKVQKQSLAIVLHNLLPVIVVLAALALVGFIIYIFIGLGKIYKKYFRDRLSLFITFFSLAGIIFFADLIRNRISINLIILFLLVQCVYIIFRSLARFIKNLR